MWKVWPKISSEVGRQTEGATCQGWSGWLEFITQSQIKGDYNFSTFCLIRNQNDIWYMFSKVTTGRIMCMSVGNITYRIQWSLSHDQAVDSCSSCSCRVLPSYLSTTKYHNPTLILTIQGNSWGFRCHPR